MDVRHIKNLVDKISKYESTRLGDEKEILKTFRELKYQVDKRKLVTTKFIVDSDFKSIILNSLKLDINGSDIFLWGAQIIFSDLMKKIIVAIDDDFGCKTRKNIAIRLIISEKV